VIETDSPRSRTLVVGTFPAPLSQTERAPFNALGFPEEHFMVLRIREGLRISRPSNSVLPEMFLLSPFALYAAFRHSLGGRHSSDYYGDSVTLAFSRGR